MHTRFPCAAQFYPGDCQANIESLIKGYRPKGLPENVVAGIVPHAGWFFSGSTAAKVFMSIKARRLPSTFVLLGAVHVPGVRTNAVYPEGAWETPIGPVLVDEKVSARLITQFPDLLQAEPRAHEYEHSIEVQTPMIKYIFPDSKIVPIAVPPGPDAVRLGRKLGRLIASDGLDAVVVGSSDLTHYGENYGFAPAGLGSDAYDWMRKNDERMIELMTQMKSSEIQKEAAENHNACGSGAIAATVAAAAAMGAGEGRLVQYTTSYDVMPEPEFDMAVGYAGMVF